MQVLYERCKKPWRTLFQLASDTANGKDTLVESLQANGLLIQGFLAVQTGGRGMSQCG